MKTTALLGLSLAGGAFADFDAPKGIVNLDDEPADRWAGVINGVLDAHGWDYTFKEVMDWAHDIIPDPVYNLLEPIFEDATILFGVEYGREIKGIYQAIVDAGHGDVIKEGDIVALNLIYSLTAWCTSTVAQDANGMPIHGRNLDYSIPGLGNLTMQVEFQSGGETQYEGTVFAGYAGLLTAMRPGGFSVSIDQYEHVNGTSIKEDIIGILTNIEHMVEGGNFIGLTLREAVGAHDNYEDAKEFLSTVELDAPCFLIMAGVSEGQGAIITRQREGPEVPDDDEFKGRGVWTLDDVAPKRWILQTNYVNWGPVPDDDNRRDPGNQRMQDIQDSADFTLDLMFDKVMSQSPTMNEDTQYTTMMCPKTGEFVTTVREH